MKNLNDYIEEYGGFSFKEKPFCEIDNLIFSQLAYTDFDKIITQNSGKTLKNTADLFFSLHNDEEIENLISISAKSARLLKECSLKKRYKNIFVTHYINSINDDIDKQFSAVHFILDDESDVVAFRGTDVTVTGIKESAMLSFMFPVPAQIEALYYFQETAMLHSGDIIVCGHSKGGNLAVFAAVNCSNSLKKRLKAVYENDAPGFPKHFFDRYDYKEIKDKIFRFSPQGSIIGRMLWHDAVSTIVKSKNSGLKQHQVSSWEVDGDRFVMEEKFERFSDLASEYINELIDYISDDELELFFDTLEYVALNMGIEDFYDTKEIDTKKALSLIDTFGELDEEQSAKFKGIIKKVLSDFTKEYLKSKTQPYIEMIEQFKKKKQTQSDDENIK